MLKPPTIPYPGAKGRLAPALVKMMPDTGRIYAEPFAGRGNVFFAAASAPLKFEYWWLNDIATAPFFQALSTHGRKIKVPPRTKAEFYHQKHAFRQGNPRAILLEPYLTFAGGGYMRGGFGGLKSATPEGYARTLARCADILDATKPFVTGVDWKHLQLEKLTTDDFVFLDPPYYGADVRAYRNSFDFEGMIDLLIHANFRWMLTEYAHPFYVLAFGKPQYTKTVQLACDGKGTRTRLECVWTNY